MANRKKVIPDAIADALTDDKPRSVDRVIAVQSGAVAPDDVLDNAADDLAAKDVDTLTDEILSYSANVGASLVEIGRRLSAVKAKLQHGEWLEWLETRVNYSVRTAQRLMKLADELQNAPTLAHLGASKALALLSLPEPDRNAMLAEGAVVNGETKSVDEMSVRELNAAIQARKEAEAKLADAEMKLSEAERDVDKFRGDLVRTNQRLELETSAKDKALAERDAEIQKRIAVSDELEHRKAAPIEVAGEKVADPDAIAEAVAEAKKVVRSEMQPVINTETTMRKDAESRAEKFEKQAKEAEERANLATSSAQKEIEKARQETESVRQELETVRAELKKAPLADSDLQLFNVLFNQTQSLVNQMSGIILKTEDNDRKTKLRAALKSLAELIGKAATDHE